MNITIEATDKALSKQGGLVLFQTLTQSLDLRGLVHPALPALVSGTTRSWHKLQGLVMGLVAGACCIDDMDRLAQDDAFVETLDGKAYTAKAYGDFLRDFTAIDCRNLALATIAQAFRLRGQMLAAGETRSMTFDFDSTANEQYGKKMEGVKANYDGIECLDTFQVFDDKGIQYWNDVRPGNTFSANGVGEVIHLILSRMPRQPAFKKLRIFSRGDSAFCNGEFFTANMSKGIGFVTAMRKNMLDPILGQVTDWKATNPQRQERIRFYDGRECEIGETLYKHDDVPRILRVVVIRAVKPECARVLFKQEQDYDYRAWVTNIGEHELNSEKLIKFYRGRGQAENYIRETKYGFDLHHYPCQKLLANKAYGLMTALAYNLMRFVALCDNVETPQFSKAIRFRLVHLPVQVVRHGGKVIFRFCQHHYEEVQLWLRMLRQLQFGFA